MKSYWYALHLKPRSEKIAQNFARALGLWSILPLRRHSYRVQRRRETRYLPVFPGYIFMRLNAEQRLAMLRSNVVVHTLRPEAQRQMIRELHEAVKALAAAEDVSVVPVFHEGMAVRIATGPFKGITGVVKRTQGATVLVLNINFLNQALQVKIDPRDVDKI